KLLDGKRVGARLVEDLLLDRGVEALNERDHRDDRRDRDDVAEDGHEGPELGRPDRVERDFRRFPVFVHASRQPQALLALLFSVEPYQIPVLHAADGVVRTRDYLIARLKAGDDLEVLVPGDAHLDGYELGVAVPEHEHTLGFLARLSGLQLGGRRDRLDAPGW